LIKIENNFLLSKKRVPPFLYSTNEIFHFSHFSKGISQSALPYRRSVPSWLKLNSEDVKEQIKKLGKKGMTPSQIGKFTGCSKNTNWIL
jgi:hypothetical protein